MVGQREIGVSTHTHTHTYTYTHTHTHTHTHRHLEYVRGAQKEVADSFTLTKK